MQSFCLNVTLWYHFHDWPLARTSLNEISDSRGDFSSYYFRCSYFPSSSPGGDVPFQAMPVKYFYIYQIEVISLHIFMPFTDSLFWWKNQKKNNCIENLQLKKSWLFFAPKFKYLEIENSSKNQKFIILGVKIQISRNIKNP